MSNEYGTLYFGHESTFDPFDQRSNKNDLLGWNLKRNQLKFKYTTLRLRNKTFRAATGLSGMVVRTHIIKGEKHAVMCPVQLTWQCV